MAASSSSGVARKVDDLGRIVLPVETRRMFGIQPGDELEVSVDGGCILLRRLEVRCVFCDGVEGLRTYRSKQVCRSCSSALSVSGLSVPGEADGGVVDAPLGDVELGGYGR